MSEWRPWLFARRTLSVARPDRGVGRPAGAVNERIQTGGHGSSELEQAARGGRGGVEIERIHSGCHGC